MLLLALLLLLPFQMVAAHAWLKVLHAKTTSGIAKNSLKAGLCWGGLGVGMLKALFLYHSGELGSLPLPPAVFLPGYWLACVGLTTLFVFFTRIYWFNTFVVLLIATLGAVFFCFDIPLIHWLSTGVWSASHWLLFLFPVFSALFYNIFRLAMSHLVVHAIEFESFTFKEFLQRSKAKGKDNPFRLFALACLVFDAFVVVTLLQMDALHAVEGASLVEAANNAVSPWLGDPSALALSMGLSVFFASFMADSCRLRGAANAEDLLQQSKALFSGQARVALEISRQIASALGSTQVHVYCWRAPSAPHNFGALDLTTGLTHLSDTFSEFGIASSEARQMNLLELWQRIVHPEDFPVLKADLNAYLAREKDNFKRVVRVLMPGDNEAVVRLQGFAVWSSLNNQPLLFQGTQIDITEESLENFQLGRSRRRQLQALNIIGHDLGTPLASISMSADLLLAQSDRLALNPMVSRYLKNIKSASMNAREYLDSTLLYARGENENKSDGLQDIAAKDFVRGIVLKHLDRYSAASDKVQIEIDNRLVVKKVRRFALEMVMNNLISNAVKYAPLPGSKVRVTVKTAEPGEHPVFSETAATIIEVHDEGIGIPEEFRTNLFSSYARAGNVDDLPGLGLGLTIVKQGCEMLDAHLEVKSKPELEKGTLFRLVLPCESVIA